MSPICNILAPACTHAVPVFARLLTFPNVLITGHQAFFTVEALTAIAEVTIENLNSFERNGRATHEVSVEKLA